MPVKREHSASPDLALVPTTPIKGRGHASATSSPKKPKTPKSKHEPPKSPLKLKSEPDPASAQLDDVGSNSDTGSARNSSSPDKYASRGRPGAKARIDAGIKVIMGRYIVERGIAVADAEKLAGLTGLTVQQVRSQLAANRQNLHRQLLAHVESIEGKK